jgi:hypothetical protein
LHAPAGDVASMVVLLRENYAFKNENITVLPESSATREGILSAIDKLVGETKPGDFVVFYYSGHGSQRRDTLSSKNQLDETIVPIDAWKGDLDVRDKEMAVRFNRIVYDKHAHLTAPAADQRWAVGGWAFGIPPSAARRKGGEKHTSYTTLPQLNTGDRRTATCGPNIPE